MKKRQQDSAEETKVVDPTCNMLNSLLNGYEEDHFNFVKSKEYKVSTGSLILDSVISMGTGIHRLTGFSGSGKTSEALQILKNTLDSIENSKGIYVKAEGRLSREIQARAGVKFVFSADEWVVGTCFVLESNIFEAVADILESLSRQCAAQDQVLCMIIDSMDALILKNDSDKKVGETYKTAGPQALMKKFLARMALPVNKYGHICLILSQVSSTIKIDPYTKELPRATSSSGGFGLTHFSDYILEFEYNYDGNRILKDPSAKYDAEKNRAIGHWVRLTVRKSDKETQGTRVEYPVRYGQSGGNSIWTEFEIADIMLKYEFAHKSGAWLTIDDSIIELAKQSGVEIKGKFQGEDALRKELTDNAGMKKLLLDKIRGILCSQNSEF